MNFTYIPMHFTVLQNKNTKRYDFSQKYAGWTSICLKMLKNVFSKVVFSLKNIQKHKNHNKQNHISHRSTTNGPNMSKKYYIMRV